ncbi:MAG: hypothetical protein ABI679_09570 [Gemmatimonadota bacterium]
MKLIARLLLVLAATANVAMAQSDQHQTIINGKALTVEQNGEFTRMYGTRPLGGNFWYDPASGLWGVVGREAFGVLRPGHSYGQLSPVASAGNTGVFINGRQINMAEALYIKSLLGSVLPGRWWLDGTTGNFGVEGNPMPAGNLFAIAKAAQSRSGTYYYNNGMGQSAAISQGCASGTTGTGDSKVDYIIGCE